MSLTDQASGNLIGGTVSGAKNVISGNLVSGVSLSDASGNVVEGNSLGTDSSGLLGGLGNTSPGSLSAGSTGNTIGGTVSGAANVIGGNAAGMFLSGAGTTGNSVQGNLIGTDSTGTRPLGNTAYGVVLLSGASGNTIGGEVAGAGNVVSGNSLGIAILGVPRPAMPSWAMDVTDAAGTAALPNSQSGVFVDDAPDNVVGSAGAGGNLISGNLGEGSASSVTSTRAPRHGHAHRGQRDRPRGRQSKAEQSPWRRGHRRFFREQRRRNRSG